MTHLTTQQFSAHLDSALIGASLQLVEHHLQMCERCRDELAALTLQDQMLTEALRGESDRELFELIGLRVQSVVHPQRARALEKAIADLESTRGERRRQAESVARRVAELREIAPAHEHRAAESAAPPQAPSPAPPAPPAAAAPPAPRPVRAAAEPDAPNGPAADLRRRALDEARARAEAEARAFALESERARQEAEQRVLDQAASRARVEVAARRKAEEEGRARAAASARVQAEHLARAAEAALADAENSARDARAARARAEARAAAAEEAGRQARRKADEARRLEAEMAAAERAADEANAARAARLAAEAEAPAEPATLSAEEVDAYRDWPSSEDAPRARRPRHASPARPESRRSPVLTYAMSAVILLAAFWYAIGRSWLHGPGDSIGRGAAQAPAASATTGRGAAATPAASVPAPALVTPPALPTEEPRKPHHAQPAASPAPPASEAGNAGEPGADAEAEPEDEPALDLGLLCGTVRDDQHRAVAGARVMMPDIDVVVVTDRVGRFCLTAPRGLRSLSVVASGYLTKRESVTVGRRTAELSVTLHHAGVGE